MSDELMDDQGFVRTYKLAGPSPKPFRRRPTVNIDGRAIREVIPNGGDGCFVVLSNGARVHVTSFPATATRHMVESAQPCVHSAPVRG